MKARIGFVSNSSSSSFVVAWDKQPETVEEIRKILYNDAERVSMWDDESFDTLQLSNVVLNDTSEATEDTIKSQIKSSYCYWDKWYNKGYKADSDLCRKYEQAYNDRKALVSKYENILGSFSDAEIKQIERKRKLERVLREKELSSREQEYIELSEKLREIRWSSKEEEDIMDELVEKSTKLFLEDNKGKFISTYCYSDDSRIGSCLEHNGTFDNLTNIHISNH